MKLFLELVPNPVLCEGICQDCARVAKVRVSGSKAPG